jgi:hypothetical protein
MIPENVERNTIIYEAWTKGHTIDEISFDTGIPRSTVGYYVRKFNKLAKNGDPISFKLEREIRDEKEMAELAFNKTLNRLTLMTSLIGSSDDLDRLYKTLMCQKLINERKRDFLPTDEERKAFLKNFGYTLKQAMDVMTALNVHQKGIPLESDPVLQDVPVILEQIKNEIIAQQKRKSPKPVKKSGKVSIHKNMKRVQFSTLEDVVNIRRKKNRKERGSRI